LFFTNRVSLGPVDPETVERVEESVSEEEKDRLARFNARPALGEILNLHDFEVGMLLALARFVSNVWRAGDCKAGYARESMGVLFLSCGR
jgi:hypothetical protein